MAELISTLLFFAGLFGMLTTFVLACLGRIQFIAVFKWSAWTLVVWLMFEIARQS